MSKFSELCQAYTDSRASYFDYRDKSYSFAMDMINRYVKFLDIPTENTRFVPLDIEPTANTTYTLHGAMHLNEDTFWHLGFQMILYSAPNVFPHQAVLLAFKFKRSEDAFQVKISADDSGHKVRLGNAADFDALFVFLQSQIEKHFRNDLQTFLESSASTRQIGFIQ